MPTIPVIDGHLDFAWNALAFDRDQTWPLARLRERERGVKDQDGRGTATVCLEEVRRAGVILFVGTLFARSQPNAPVEKCYLRSDSDFASPAIAHAAALGQLAYYALMEREGRLRLIRTAAALADVDPAAPATRPGCIVLMEGADPITTPAELAEWHGLGVRAFSLAHAGPCRYAVGNGADGPLSPEANDLLAEAHRLGMALDVSHLSDTSFRQAMDRFPGPVFASHTNCRAIVPRDRQFSDDQLKAIIARDGVIGMVLHHGMLLPADILAARGGRASLSDLVPHIDHLCQLAGNPAHVAIGSDLDGGFGKEKCPREIDTHSDLQKLVPLLHARGYTDADVAAIFHGNWLRFWGAALKS